MHCKSGFECYHRYLSCDQYVWESVSMIYYKLGVVCQTFAEKNCALKELSFSSSNFKLQNFLSIQGVHQSTVIQTLHCEFSLESSQWYLSSKYYLRKTIDELYHQMGVVLQALSKLHSALNNFSRANNNFCIQDLMTMENVLQRVLEEILHEKLSFKLNQWHLSGD